jgi:hypothetical protein
MELFAIGILAEIIEKFGFWISYFNNAKTTKIQKNKLKQPNKNQRE